MIVARVQAHPSRAHLHEPLVDALASLPTALMVHESDPPNPWEGYRRCLSDLPDCSHVLIIQDDALPCVNFSEALMSVAERHTDTPVCLFLGAYPASTATLARRAKKDVRYIPLGSSAFVPLVAVLWPREKAQEFLEWSETGRNITRADDGNAAKWMKATRQQFLVSIPSLVQHNDFTPSVKGGRQHRPGAEAWRRAVLLAEDALHYEW